MNSLSKEEKDLVLDFYFRCSSLERIDQAKDLIASDQRAAELYSQLEMSLKPLDYANYEPCPDNLVELTVARLKLAASASDVAERITTSGTKLEKLLVAEQSKAASVDIGVFRRNNKAFWQNLSNVGAVAAAAIIVVAISYQMSATMRQSASKAACANNSRYIGAGMARYSNDNEGSLPSVTTSAGSPYWKVADQREKNESNTRHLWLLVQGDYVEAQNFVCTGQKDGQVVRINDTQKEKFHDFPSRQSITYSYMLMNEKNAKHPWKGKTVLMADRNPIFERFWQMRDRDKFETISLSERLREAMSSSHDMKGQTVLFYDGSVEFKKKRVIDGDDIYTLEGRDKYYGSETPSDDAGDVFLVP